MLLYILLVALLVVLCLSALGAVILFVIRSEPEKREWTPHDLFSQLFDFFTQVAIDHWTK